MHTQTHALKPHAHTHKILFVLKLQNELDSLNKFVTLYMCKINHIHTKTQYETQYEAVHIIHSIVCPIHNFKFIGFYNQGLVTIPFKFYRVYSFPTIAPILVCLGRSFEKVSDQGPQPITGSVS